MVKTKWLASLSDGTTAIENEGQFKEIAGELSPWQKFLIHLSEKDLHITGMRIQVERLGGSTQTYNLPSFNKTSEGNHEKWVTLRPMIPESYNYFRWVTKSLTDYTLVRHYIEIRAIYADFSVSLFVDENEGNESWVVLHR